MLARIDRAFADRERTVDQMRRFVGDASHELRTPLVSLRGYAELYRMGAIQEPDDVAQAMDRIEREAIRMGGLVEDLLELARLDEAKPLELAPVDLLPIAQDAALDASVSAPARRDHRHRARAGDGLGGRGSRRGPERARRGRRRDHRVGRPGIHHRVGEHARVRRRHARAAAPPPPRARSRRCRCAMPEVVPLPDVGPIVLAEENKIRQVVTNLVGNAMRFTPDDSPIEFAVEVDREGGFGQISIVDHGDGVPPQLREKIFQRFWRADTSRTRDTGGSGLGLAIVAGIVANHDGHVEVLETPGGGATFRVSLPLLLPDDTAAESTEEPAAAPKKGLRS